MSRSTPSIPSMSNGHGSPTASHGARTKERAGGSGSGGGGHFSLLPKRGAEPMLPCNPQAERSLLGALLIAPEQFADLADKVTGGDFYDPRYALIWDAMRGVAERGQTPASVQVIDELARRGQLAEAGGQSDITALANDITFNAFDAPQFAAIVQDRAAKRRAIKMLADGTAVAFQTELDVATLHAFLREQVERLESHYRPVGAEWDAEDGYTAEELLALELPPARYAVPDLIPEGLSILAAKQKIGKSWLALGLCIATAAGGYALGRAERVPQGDALYLALEDQPRRLISRMQRVLSGKAPPRRLRVWTECPRLDQGGVQKIEQWLRRASDPRLVVIDVLAKVRPPRARGGDIYAEDYAVMSPLKALADKYHCAIVVIHHTRKAGAEDIFDEIRDSAGISGACDAVMVLQRARGEVDATLHLTGRDVDEQEIALRFNKADCTWQWLGAASEVPHTPEQREVVELLQATQRPMRPVEIAQCLDKSRDAIKMLLSRMQAARLVISDGSGAFSCYHCYRVPPVTAVTPVTADRDPSRPSVSHHAAAEAPDQFWPPGAVDGYSQTGSNAGNTSNAVTPVTPVTLYEQQTPHRDVAEASARPQSRMSSGAAMDADREDIPIERDVLLREREHLSLGTPPLGSAASPTGAPLPRQQANGYRRESDRSYLSWRVPQLAAAGLALDDAITRAISEKQAHEQAPPTSGERRPDAYESPAADDDAVPPREGS